MKFATTFFAAIVFCLPAAPSFGAKLKVPQQFPTINDALTAAMDGDVILVDEGVYPEKVVIHLKTNLKIRGSGKPVIKPDSSGVGLWIFNSSGITVSGFKVKGATDQGIRVMSSHDVVIRKCDVRGSGGEGILLNANSTAICLEQNKVRKAGSYGIDVQSDGAVIRDNQVSHVNDHGIRVMARNVMVENNAIEDLLSAGIHVAHTLSSTQVVLADNQIDHTGKGIEFANELVGVTAIGNRITSSDDPGLTVYGSAHSIVDNRVKNANSTGIAVLAKECVVTGNRATDCIGSGLILMGDSNTVDHNRMMRSDGHGLAIMDGSNGNLISANLARKSTVYDMANYTPPEDNAFVDNKFKTIMP